MGYIVKIEKCNDENIAEKKEIFKTSYFGKRKKNKADILYEIKSSESRCYLYFSRMINPRTGEENTKKDE